MKKILVPILMILLLAGLFSCSTSGGAGEPLVKVKQAEAGEADAGVDDVSSATPEGEGWMITLRGVREDQIWQSDMEAWKQNPGSLKEMDLEKKGETHRYAGITLAEVVAMVDDPSGGMPYVFREDLWKQGYDITLTADDGYSFTFSTLEADPREVLLADTVDGEPAPPQIVGNVTSKAWVRNLAEIELSLAPVDLAENNFELELEINGQLSAYTIKEMEAMPIYVEDKGNYTNSYGNNFQSVWGGIRLIPLLEQFMEVTPETAIKIVAMDGYEMSYGGDMLLDQADGDWILAFKENGEYMPEDPGYIRLVKVGPQNPNITGHVSARMIKKIVTEGEPFRNFELTIVENGTVEVFDRQTLQSGVVTNRNRVVYHDRKSGTDTPCMGISLWRLLERLKGYKAVTIEAADGFSVTLDNSQLENNDDVILAMYTGEDESLLAAEDWPLKLVWDKDASVVPDGIKAVRNVVKVILVY